MRPIHSSGTEGTHASIRNGTPGCCISRDHSWRVLSNPRTYPHSPRPEPELAGVNVRGPVPEVVRGVPEQPLDLGRTDPSPHTGRQRSLFLRSRGMDMLAFAARQTLPLLRPKR